MSLEALAEKLRAIALDYPETYEEQPWGHRVVKCAGKMFFTCDVHDGELRATVKVPRSGKQLLERPYAEPTHYGMGKYGWVTLTFKSAKQVPLDEMRAWIEETFVSMAPKKLVKARAQGAATLPKAKAKKIAARAVLVCADPLRAKRAVDEYAERGVGLDVVGDRGQAEARQGQGARHRYRPQPRRRDRAGQEDRRIGRGRCTCLSPACATRIRRAGCATLGSAELLRRARRATRRSPTPSPQRALQGWRSARILMAAPRSMARSSDSLSSLTIVGHSSCHSPASVAKRRSSTRPRHAPAARDCPSGGVFEQRDERVVVERAHLRLGVGEQLVGVGAHARGTEAPLDPGDERQRSGADGGQDDPRGRAHASVRPHGASSRANFSTAASMSRRVVSMTCSASE